MSRDAKYGAEQVEKHLVGGTITKAILDQGSEYFGFLVRMPDGTEKVAWIDSDAEGNSTGWLRVEGKVKPIKRNLLHQTEKFEVWTERKKVHVKETATDEEYFWPPRHTGAILSEMRATGVDTVCERLVHGTAVAKTG